MSDVLDAAKKLVDTVEFDCNGVNGKGGNGGLLSDATIKAAGALRIALSRVASQRAHQETSDKPSPGNETITGETVRGERCELPPTFASTPAPVDLSVGSRWRVFEDTTHGYWGIEIEQASNDSDPIMYPIKIHRERVAIVVDAHNAEVARLESLHRSEISDMAERFRSVNVSEAVKQLADILPAAPAELSVAPVRWQRRSSGTLNLSVDGWVDVPEEDISSYRERGQEIRTLYASPAPAELVVVDVDALATRIVTAACELDGPADASGDDTISITTKDLEAVVHRHATAALESSHEA